MKYFLQILLISLTVLLVSCETSNTGRDYRYDNNGLVFEAGSEKLYTGRIIDTAEVIIEMDIVDGKRTGEFITYHLNGNIEKQGTMVENKNEGEWKYYYQDGTLELTGTFKNDKAEGEWTFYHTNGNKKESGNYKAGERIGTWSIYNEEGEVIQELDSGSKVLPQKPNNNS